MAPDKVPGAKFFKFSAAELPDELFRPETPVDKWLATCEMTENTAGFPDASLCRRIDIPWDVHVERCIGIALYMACNVLPFALPALLLAFILLGHYWMMRAFVYSVLLYVGILYAIEVVFFTPRFLKKYNCSWEKTGVLGWLLGGQSREDNVQAIRESQYYFTERNIQKYLSMTFVWPASMHRTGESGNGGLQNRPVIFCMVPHGLTPLGITAYPMWSKLWNDRLARCTAAPIVLKIPLIASLLKTIGYIPAKAKNIEEALTKKEQNVVIVLDGIAGMFQDQGAKKLIDKLDGIVASHTPGFKKPVYEKAYLKKRKGIVKIALRTGTPIVPVYGFGHTDLWTIKVDPFGILQRLSLAVEASITPFFGRWWWPLGPPVRQPVTVCLGDPVMCPCLGESIVAADIDEWHGKLLEGFQTVFDTHKVGYYGQEHVRTLKFV